MNSAVVKNLMIYGNTMLYPMMVLKILKHVLDVMIIMAHFFSVLFSPEIETNTVEKY